MTCAAGTIPGFPLTLKQNLFETWSTCPDKDKKTPEEIMRTLTVTSDLTMGLVDVIPKGVEIGTRVQVGRFTRIVLPDSMTGWNSTITFHGSRYKASPYISIVGKQHHNLIKYRPNDVRIELIWAFQKEENKIANEDPQVILLCRPAMFTSSAWPDMFWDTVNASLADSNKNKSMTENYSIRKIFPMSSTVTYELCLNSKVTNSFATTTVQAPFKIRVYVINDILQIPNSTTGEQTSVRATCPVLVDYSLITLDGANGPASIVNNAPKPGIFQFVSGAGPPTSENFKLPKIDGSSYISDWTNVKQYIKIQLPDEEYRFNVGNDVNIPRYSPRKKFKCYTIDPKKDIVGDQITIDPKTGQPLEEYMREEDYGTEGDIPIPGILPGDIEWYLQRTIGVIGALILLAYLFYWLRLLINGVSPPSGKDGWAELQSAGVHFIVWASLLGGLIAMEMSFEKKEGFTDTKPMPSKDKRCYTVITNALIGTEVTIKKGPNADRTIISYTEEECESQMGGYYKKEEIESGDVEPSSFTGPIGFCYSVDPKVTIPLSTQNYSLTICAPKQPLPKPKPLKRQCYMPTPKGPVLIGKELALTSLGLDKFKPLKDLVSYTTEECDRLAGIYKKITVPSTFIKSDGPGGPNVMDIGFCYRSGSDLSKKDVDVKLNYSYTCSPTFSP
jgi:hypothetical protein